MCNRTNISSSTCFRGQTVAETNVSTTVNICLACLADWLTLWLQRLAEVKAIAKKHLLNSGKKRDHHTPTALSTK
jgi:hypothetical protein